MADNVQKSTSGVEWRRPREEGYVVTLPSGNSARLRPVALDVLITSGEIPDLLTPLAARMLWTAMDTDAIADDAEVATNMVELFNLVCQASFLEPRIVEQPAADDEVSLLDISFEDRAAVFQLTIEPARVLRKFRDQQARNVASPPAGGDDEPKAK